MRKEKNMTEESEVGVIEAANKVAKLFDARVFLYSGTIDSRGFGKLVSSMQPSKTRPHRPNTVLLLTTYGGHANAAYQIARAIQNTSDKFILCIPSFCKSAGTLIALGASQILMNSVSELGPLDVQLFQRDELGQRRSGLVVRTAFEGLAEESFKVFERVMLGIKVSSRQLISFETASRIAATITTGVMAPVYSQINPDILGNDLRDLSIAFAYGERLAEHAGNAKPDTVEHLVHGYPSHDFIIDRAEAETLFRNVAEPQPEIATLVNHLGMTVYTQRMPHEIKRLDKLPEEAEDDAPAPRTKARGSSVANGRKAKGGSDPEGERQRDAPPE